MARRANGLSRKRLAKGFGIDESTVLRWETGRGRPATQLLAEFSDAFTVDKDESHRPAIRITKVVDADCG